MAQARDRAAVERAILEDAAVEAWHRRENADPEALDQRRPDGGIGGAIVEHRRCSVGPRVDQADAQSVGPVEGAGVEDDVAGADTVPAAIHRPAAPGTAVAVQHALWLADSAGV